jgi:Uma2 family endonuclease
MNGRPARGGCLLRGSLTNAVYLCFIKTRRYGSAGAGRSPQKTAELRRICSTGSSRGLQIRILVRKRGGYGWRRIETYRHSRQHFTAMKLQNRSKSCRIFQKSAKLQLQEGDAVVYHDVMLTCDPADWAAEQNVQHPSIIVDVLSPSTELLDRNAKWQRYRRLSSLRYFLLVSTNTCMVEMYSRPHERQPFHFQAFEEMTDEGLFAELGFGLTLSKIYQSVLPDQPER